MRNAILYIIRIRVYSCDIFRDAEDMGIFPPINYKILSLGDSYTIGQSVCDECNFPVQLKDSLQTVLYNDTINVEIIAKLFPVLPIPSIATVLPSISNPLFFSLNQSPFFTWFEDVLILFNNDNNNPIAWSPTALLFPSGEDITSIFLLFA